MLFSDISINYDDQIFSLYGAGDSGVTNGAPPHIIISSIHPVARQYPYWDLLTRRITPDKDSQNLNIGYIEYKCPAVDICQSYNSMLKA